MGGYKHLQRAGVQFLGHRSFIYRATCSLIVLSSNQYIIHSNTLYDGNHVEYDLSATDILHVNIFPECQTNLQLPVSEDTIGKTSSGGWSTTPTETLLDASMQHYHLLLAISSRRSNHPAHNQ